MQLKKAEARYSLLIRSYPSESSILRVCELIYGSTDVKLLASLSTLPFSVGRSFSPYEAEQLAKNLRELDVGYSFKGLTQDLPPIEYQPSFKQSSPNEDTAKIRALGARKKSPLRIFGWGLVVAAAALSIWFGIAHNPISFKKAPPSEPSTEFAPDTRAMIEKVVKDVEFRRDRDLLWEKAALNTHLKDSDAIRTFESSLATLKYREGSTVLVKPNTLIVIGSEAGGANQKIHLDDGGVSTRLEATSTPQKWSIVTKAGILELETPRPGAKQSRIDTSISGDKMKVSVSEGRALLRPLAADKTPVEIQTRQSLEATPTEVSAPQPMTLEIFLRSPAEGQVIHIDPERATPISFEWSAPEVTGDQSVEYEWFAATDADMKNILLTQKTTATAVQVNYLDLGTIYWGVRSVVDGMTYESRVQTLHVKKPSK